MKITCYLRQLRNGRFWYASWNATPKDSLVYQRVTKPTGVSENPREKDLGKQEARDAAILIREAWLKEEATPRAPRMLLYKEWAGTFYKSGSPYLKRQIDRGKLISKHWASTMDSLIRMHALPRWAGTRLDAFRVLDVEDWLASLPLSPQTRKTLCYAAFAVPFREATRGGIISNNPLSELQAPIGEGRRRDVFTMRELAMLFPRDREKLTEVWGSFSVGVMFSLLAYTGLREGEIRALQWSDIQNDFLVVSRAVKRDGAIGSLKKRGEGDFRVVILLPHIAQMLGELQRESPPSTLMFPSKTGRVFTMGYFSHKFGKTLAKVGIVKEGRFLDVHSLRHTYNTLVRPVLSQDVLMQVMGHKSMSVNDIYSHPSIESKMKQLGGVREAIAATFEER